MHQPNTRSNKNAIPFTSIDLKDDSGIIEYIDNILELAPIQLTEQGHEVLFKTSMKYLITPLIILVQIMEFMLVDIGCLRKNIFLFLFMILESVFQH